MQILSVGRPCTVLEVCMLFLLVSLLLEIDVELGCQPKWQG